MALAAPRWRIPRSSPSTVGDRHRRGDVLDVEVRRLGAVPDHPEALVGDDLGAGLVADPSGPAEVVGVAVGDDHRVHAWQRDAGAAETLDELLERAPAGQTGVDDGHAALVLEDVAVDVTQSRHVDRQLRPQHARRHLGDLGGGGLLLLATGAIGHHAIVRPSRAPSDGSDWQHRDRGMGAVRGGLGASAGCCCGRRDGCPVRRRPRPRWPSSSRRATRRARCPHVLGPLLRAAARRRRARRRRRSLDRSDAPRSPPRSGPA